MAHKGSTLGYHDSFLPRSDHSRTINGMQSRISSQPQVKEKGALSKFSRLLFLQNRGGDILDEESVTSQSYLQEIE